ncbi:MAG: GNAT family N-acetyltransferase [Bacteroidota bacterium]
MKILLKTERLILREFELSDAPFIFELLNSPGWLQYIGDRGIKTLKDAEHYLSNRLIPSYAKWGFGFYVCLDRETGQPVGTCGLVDREGLEDVDIGYALLPAFEGQGFAFESTAAMAEYAKEILGIKRLVAITTKDNERSIHLLERLDFHHDGQVQLPGDNEVLNLYVNVKT